MQRLRVAGRRRTQIEIERGMPAGAVVQPAPAVGRPAPAAVCARRRRRRCSAPVEADGPARVCSLRWWARSTARPQPGAKPFVEVGDVVDVGQTVAIVEAMKLMNHVEADVGGRVAEILVEDGELVEFEQALIVLEPVDD